MLIPLICVTAHHNTPGVRPGEGFTLEADATGAWTLRLPVTPLILQQIGQAIADGALTLDPTHRPPSPDEMAELAEITRIGLLERVAEGLAQPRGDSLRLLAG